MSNTPGSTVLVTLIVGGLASSAVAQTRGTPPDSAKAVLTLGAADRGLVELRGETINDFRLYLSAEQSRIGWWLDDTLYLYTLRGEAHDQRAMTLFNLLRQSGLASFIAERHGKRPPGMNPHAEVRALHLAAVPGSITEESSRSQE
jgi:hypothetical protein